MILDARLTEKYNKMCLLVTPCIQDNLRSLLLLRGRLHEGEVTILLRLIFFLLSPGKPKP